MFALANGKTAMPTDKDLVDVINRTALIENILNQVIEAFCEPRQEPFMFFWNVILDSSIMPMGSKVKVVMAVAQEMNIKLDQKSIHHNRSFDRRQRALHLD